MFEIRSGTAFIRLPAALQREIPGGCQCNYCKAHPAKTPMWDVVATDGQFSWTVHYPDLVTKQEV